MEKSVNIILEEMKKAVEQNNCTLVKNHLESKHVDDWYLYTVLAHNIKKNEFIVWTYNAESIGLCHGHYFTDSDEALKYYEKKTGTYIPTKFEVILEEMKKWSFAFYSINKDEIKMQCTTDLECYIILDTNKQSMTIYTDDSETIGDVIDVDSVCKIIDNDMEYNK